MHTSLTLKVPTNTYSTEFNEPFYGMFDGGLVQIRTSTYARLTNNLEFFDSMTSDIVQYVR